MKTSRRVLKACLVLLLGFSAVATSAINNDKRAEDTQEAGNSYEKGRSELNILFASLALAVNKQEADGYVNKIWQRWFNTDNQTVNAMLQGVLHYRRDQNLKQALILSDRIVAKFPAYSEGWNQRATLFFMLGDYQASLSDIEQTLVREPRHFGALSGRASIYLIQGDRQAAVETIKEALVVNPFLNEKAILGAES